MVKEQKAKYKVGDKIYFKIVVGDSIDTPATILKVLNTRVDKSWGYLYYVETDFSRSRCYIKEKDILYSWETKNKIR